MVTESDERFLRLKSFFFLLNKRYRVQGLLLLRLFSFTAVGLCTAQAVSRFVCKKSVRFSGTDFLHSTLCQKTGLSGGKV